MLKNYSKIEVNEYNEKRYFNDEGKCHRLDGPAVEYSDGSKFWYINGNGHRNIDPSSEWLNRVKQWWYFNGKNHRVGSSSSSFYECWFIQGKEYTKKQYFNKVWDI